MTEQDKIEVRTIVQEELLRACGSNAVTLDPVFATAAQPVMYQTSPAGASITVYKHVIKLDRNFHVYVHGSPSLMERGVDETGRKFIKLYYQQES